MAGTILKAVGGSKALAAATADQVITDVAGTGKYGYLSRFTLTCVATAAVATTVVLKDAASGAVLWRLVLATAPAVNTMYTIEFPHVPRTAALNGVFVMDTTGAAVTWDVSVNGYSI